MSKLGVVEGFYGPAWGEVERKSYAPFLQKVGGDFYIYAPKQDQHLRKAWRETWDQDFIEKMTDLKNHFHRFGIRFGVAISPFGLGLSFEEQDKKDLAEKIRVLETLDLDLLGVFFDDMPTNPNLGPVQVEVLEMIQASFKKEIVFCPTYYSFDPILEKVFGKKPEGYIEFVGAHVPKDMAIAWTGPKVISPEISLAHADEVHTLLNRDPFIWENFFANDGPKNCKFLKLLPFTGREAGLSEKTKAWAFNMMNQAYLSQIVFLASYKVLEEKLDPSTALEASLSELCTPDFAEFILEHREEFLKEGLDKLTPEQKQSYILGLQKFTDPAAQEILKWLKGEYVVGNECLTD